MEGLTRADNSTQTGLDIEISCGGGKENSMRFHLTSPLIHILVPISFYPVTGLLLADGAPTVQWGGRRLFEPSTGFFYGNSCNSGTASQKIVPKVGN